MHEYMQTALHEYAHYTWATTLSKEQQLRYCKLWDETSTYVTLYARTDCEEDFAETLSKTLYLFYTHEELPRDRQEYFEELLDHVITSDMEMLDDG